MAGGRFQRRPSPAPRCRPPSLSGSNGIAISPSVALDHHALLWINPHTSFYFRSELQMVSGEGLDAYGAVTWGQFFVYQGFNATAGWMHTSSGVRNISWFLETISRRGGHYYYRYGGRELPVRTRRIVVRYKTANGVAEKAFTAYYTQHGPVIARGGDRWETIDLMQRPIAALIQDFSRTKARDYAQFRKTMQLHADSSNNTIFADSEGNIAYWHSNWIPQRSDAFDWGKPVDGSDPATAFHGLLTLDRDATPAQPAERLALQLQQLALVGGRAVQPEAAGLSAVRGPGHGGERARLSRPEGAQRRQKLDHGIGVARRHSTATCLLSRP